MIIDQYTYKRKDIAVDLVQIEDELTSLEDQREMNIDTTQEVLLLTRDVYKAYTKASFNLKRQYLGFFWERFDVAEGVILRSVPSPLFQELLTAEEAYFKNPKTENALNSKVSEEGILRNLLLPPLGTFGTVDWKAVEREMQWLAVAMPSLNLKT